MLLSKVDFSDGSGPPLAWDAYTACAQDGTPPLLSEIQCFLDNKNLSKQMLSLLSALETALKDPKGPQLFLNNSRLCHEAVKGTGIYELIKKPLRLYWFYGQGNKVIILSAVHQKTTPKTPPLVVKRLKGIQDTYHLACKKSSLKVINN